MLLLHMEFERIGACHRPYTQKRSCLPPLIRLPFGQPPSPRGRHPSDGSVHFYVVQPYTPSDTFGDTSPYTPGGLRFAASAYGIRAHRGMPPPLHAKTIVPTAPHPSALRAATFPQGKASLRWVGTLLRCPTVSPPSHASVAHLPLHAGRQRLTESLPGIRAHRSMPPPLQNLPGMLAESAFPTLPLH